MFCKANRNCFIADRLQRSRRVGERDDEQDEAHLEEAVTHVLCRRNPVQEETWSTQLCKALPQTKTLECEFCRPVERPRSAIENARKPWLQPLRCVTNRVAEDAEYSVNLG